MCRYPLIALTYFFSEYFCNATLRKLLSYVITKEGSAWQIDDPFGVQIFAKIAIISLLINVLVWILERKLFYKNHVLHSSLASSITQQT